jgi:hypothetical protein
MKIASITASFIGQAVRLVIMYVETFKTVIIVNFQWDDDEVRFVLDQHA